MGERKQNAERRNHRRFRNIFRRLLSNRRRHDRCAGTKRENEKESREYSSALRISIERKYRRKEVKEANEKMEAEKPKKMDTSTSGNMTISGSMDKLVEEEEKKPQYRVTKISEVVVPPGEGWF